VPVRVVADLQTYWPQTQGYQGHGITGFISILQQNVIPVSRAGQKENRIVK
jgi:hypothetical protein